MLFCFSGSGVRGLVGNQVNVGWSGLMQQHDHPAPIVVAVSAPDGRTCAPVRIRNGGSRLTGRSHGCDSSAVGVFEGDHNVSASQCGVASYLYVQTGGLSV